MEWDDARRMLQEISDGCLDDDELEPLLEDFYQSAIRYACDLAERALQAEDERDKVPACYRSGVPFRRAVASLAQGMAAKDKSVAWHSRWHDAPERWVIAELADLACFACAILGLVCEVPFRYEMVVGSDRPLKGHRRKEPAGSSADDKDPSGS